MKDIIWTTTRTGNVISQVIHPEEGAPYIEIGNDYDPPIRVWLDEAEELVRLLNEG